MTLTVKHNKVTGAPADPTAIVDGPAWDDAHALTGLLGLDHGGTGADLSITGGTSKFLKQTTMGGAVIVDTATPNDITTTTQIITSGTVTVANTDSMIALNKTSGSATSITLPLASAKNGALLIVDFKGDSDVNPITVTASGSDKFPGNLSSWTISSQGISVLFTPISGLGYAVS